MHNKVNGLLSVTVSNIVLFNNSFCTANNRFERFFRQSRNLVISQSNLAGNGRTLHTTTNSKIWMMNMDNRWEISKCPLHRVYDASAVHMGRICTSCCRSRKRSGQNSNANTKKCVKRVIKIGGVGRGIYFARNILKATAHAIALIASAIRRLHNGVMGSGKKILGRKESGVIIAI